MNEYRPHTPYDAPVDPKRCRFAVYDRVRSHQCTRKATHGKWCKQHSPEAIEERRRKSDEKYRAGVEARKRAVMLREATVAQLEAELARRRA